eukprot:Blabericola_migrator_1__12890@NODE_842_length_6289_cov_33_263742_g594_i0_p1_GENE_NODE_842_length_6289_cov_33_263742_g594_i0NODE_842_length_6289_cov_33_263742_g594_i0_p1_ORF_typecomplete_len624_score72_37HC2/PF07382_11/1_8e05HC2/PF07382_11/7_6e02_NODE_842_length_6289_cov_33_263742_g594_i010952966
MRGLQTRSCIANFTPQAIALCFIAGRTHVETFEEPLDLRVKKRTVSDDRPIPSQDTSTARQQAKCTRVQNEAYLPHERQQLNYFASPAAPARIADSRQASCAASQSTSCTHPVDTGAQRSWGQQFLGLMPMSRMRHEFGVPGAVRGVRDSGTTHATQRHPKCTLDIQREACLPHKRQRCDNHAAQVASTRCIAGSTELSDPTSRKTHPVDDGAQRSMEKKSLLSVIQQNVRLRYVEGLHSLGHQFSRPREASQMAQTSISGVSLTPSMSQQRSSTVTSGELDNAVFKVPLGSVREMCRARANKPEANKPEANKPEANKPAANKPEANKPAADKPAADKPAAHKPAADKPGSNTAGPTYKSKAPMTAGGPTRSSQPPNAPPPAAQDEITSSEYPSLYHQFQFFEYPLSPMHDSRRFLSRVTDEEGNVIEPEITNHLLTLRRAEAPRFRTTVRRAWSAAADKIRARSDSAVVKFICDFVQLIALISSPPTFEEACVLYFRHGGGTTFINVYLKFAEMCEEYSALLEAIKTENERKTRLRRLKGVRGYWIGETLPAILQRPECLPWLQYVHDLCVRNRGRASEGLDLLRVLATAGHVMENMEKAEAAQTAAKTEVSSSELECSKES